MGWRRIASYVVLGCGHSLPFPPTPSVAAVWSLARERAVAALFGSADSMTEADMVSGSVSDVGRSSGTPAACGGGESTIIGG